METQRSSDVPTTTAEEHASLRRLLSWLERDEDAAPLARHLDDLRAHLGPHFEREEAPEGLFALVRARVPAHGAQVDALEAQHRTLMAEVVSLARDVAAHRDEEAAGIEVEGRSLASLRVRVEGLVDALREHERQEGRVLTDAVDTMLEGGSTMENQNEVEIPAEVGKKKFAALTCGDIMSGPVRVLKETSTLRDVHGLMKMAGFRHVPIVDEGGKLVGLVSDRDVHLAWHQGPDTLVSSFMTRYTQWAHPEATARDVTARMLNDHIGCMPVVDADSKPVGIVTETDLLRFAYRALTIQEALSD